MPHKNSTTSLVLAIIITALVVGTSVYYWQNSENPNLDQESLQNRIEKLEKENAELKTLKESVDQETAKQQEIDQNFDKCMESIDPSLEGQERDDAETECYYELYEAL